jgi:hypothetical protein
MKEKENNETKQRRREKKAGTGKEGRKEGRKREGGK